MKPVLLLETRTEPMGFLTSRSLRILEVTSQGAPVSFCYDYQDFADMLCYGQHYQLLESVKENLTIRGAVGDDEYTYYFTL